MHTLEVLNNLVPLCWHHD